jgi:SAM-dependent methyltransferase
MTDTTDEGTIDWNQYWQEADDVYRDDANGSAEYVVDPLLEFLAATGAPASYADVGCGGGAVVFEVARRYPGATVVGYDAAEPALEATRQRAREAGLENVALERAVLPAFEPGEQFDVVSAFFTLCYVADVERALRTLYDAVAPGGHLVITYHNRFARSIFEGIAESPHDHLDESTAWHPETFADRFELVLEGENLLSYERIQDVLGTWPRSVWSVAEDAERYGAWRQNPLVYVPK